MFFIIIIIQMQHNVKENSTTSTAAQPKHYKQLTVEHYCEIYILQQTRPNFMNVKWENIYT